MSGLDEASSGGRPLGSFSNKVVTQSTEREGERANGISKLKIQPAKADVMQQPEERRPK